MLIALSVMAGILVMWDHGILEKAVTSGLIFMILKIVTSLA